MTIPSHLAERDEYIPRRQCLHLGTVLAPELAVGSPAARKGCLVASNEQTTVVGVFLHRGNAETAIDKLWHAGFRHDQIGMAAPGKPLHEADTPTGELEEHAAGGAATGAVAGGGLGALAGAVVGGLIPGIGPVVAAGILVGLVGGAAFGAAAGTFLGPFIALELSEDEARHYESQFKAGKTIVVVKAQDRVPEAIAILHSCGGVVNAPGEAMAAARP
jgi:hypothetical protein